LYQKHTTRMKYCLKCKRPTADVGEPTVKVTHNHRLLTVMRCEVCGKQKCYFVRQKTGKGLLNKAINSLPIELHLPGYQYCGPGTKLEKRLARGDPGINALDRACQMHNIAYNENSELDKRHKADKMLASAAQSVREDPNNGWKEKLAATLVKKAMDVKVKF